LQQQAFRIGRESKDNDQLQQHPDINNYIQSMREFNPRLKAMVSDLQLEYKRVTGRQAEKPKKRAQKQIRGLSEGEIRARARAAVANDDRPFRSKGMDLISEFRERQLQMQDKQRDLQTSMDGPDWPKEDWPLSTADAKHVGEAENMISGALQELSKRLEPLGGLGRVHESDDPVALEQLKALSEMMSGYCELIDRHVSAVRRVYRSSKRRGPPRRKGAPTAAAGSPGTGASAGSALPAAEGGLPSAGASLRDRLLSFGSPTGSGRPFDWLRGDDSGRADGAAAADGMAPTGRLGSSGLGMGLGSGAVAGTAGRPPAPLAGSLGAGRQFAPPAAGAGAGGAGHFGAQGGPSSSGAFGFPSPGPAAGRLEEGVHRQQHGLGAAPVGEALPPFGGMGAFGSRHIPPQPRAWYGGVPPVQGSARSQYPGEL